MRVYLDYNATTPTDPRVTQRIVELLDEGPLNPGSQHAQGRKARALLDHAEADVLDTLGLTKTHRVVFCGSSTEAINLAIRGLLADATDPSIVLSSVEHPAVAQTVDAVASPRVVPVDRVGAIDIDVLRTKFPGAKLATFMYANNETGGILPVRDIVNAARETGVPLLLDCCQAPGKCDFRVSDARPDMLVVSGHKTYAPAGIAALAIRRDVTLKSLTTGGGQQYGMRAGTETVILANALALALKIACNEPHLERSASQCERLFTAIREISPHAVLTIPDASRRLANTLHYRIPGLTSERQVIAFDMEGVECSAAAACESGAVKPSKVLLGMGYNDQESKEGVRISVGRFTTDEEIDFACATIQRALARLVRF